MADVDADLRRVTPNMGVLVDDEDDVILLEDVLDDDVEEDYDHVQLCDRHVVK